jgi:hypothetical protein
MVRGHGVPSLPTSGTDPLRWADAASLGLHGHQAAGQVSDLRVALERGDGGSLSFHGMGEDLGQEPEAARQRVRPPAPLAGSADRPSVLCST